MRRFILLAVALLVTGFAGAQGFKTGGKTAKGLVPQGWTVVCELKNDFNKDGISDLVIVAKYEAEEDSEKVIKQPVGIYFGGKDGVFTLFRQCDDVLPSGSETDFYEASLSLNAKGSLVVSFQEFHSMGSGYVGTNSVTARYQNGDFYIIGDDSNAYSRMTGSGERISSNYLTHKRYTTTFHQFDKSVKPKTVRETLPNEPLKKL